jgi:hypothetical protein
MLARWRPRVGGRVLQAPVGFGTCRSYQTPTSPRRAARSSGRQRQSTVNLDDLPLRANDSTGKPKEALPEYRNGMESKVLIAKGKGKAKAEEEIEELDFEIPRLNELGRE